MCSDMQPDNFQVGLPMGKSPHRGGQTHELHSEGMVGTGTPMEKVFNMQRLLNENAAGRPEKRESDSSGMLA